MARPKPLRHDGRDFLTTAQVARRLGVKEQTVYAYVSRGVLTSCRIRGIAGSLFAVDEIEALADRDGARRGSGGAVERIRTQITLQDDGVLYYRGVPATELANNSFERVAGLLWTGDEFDVPAFVSDPDIAARARAAVAALPSNARLVDRFRLVVDIAGVSDAMRFDTTEPALLRAAPALIALMIDAAGDVPGDPESSLAQRLCRVTGGDDTDSDAVAILDSALILLADHGLAASTLAVRMAASTRANLYAAVSVGLGVMDGPYHGAATSRAYRFLGAALGDPADDPMTVLAEYLRDHDTIPGCGHVLYTGADPRALFLLDRMRLRTDARSTRTVQVAQRISDEVTSRRGTHPNSDFALAVVAHGLGLRPDAAEAVFAVARTAGWVAHALEEYRERGLRFRVPGVYTGVRPSRR